MKNFIAVSVVVLMALTAGFAHAAGEPAKRENQGIIRGEVSVIKATVAAIDPEKRTVTLRDERGNVRDFKFGKEAVNLPQVRVGDIVTMKYHESIAVEVIKPGSASASGEKTTIVRAKPGEMPGGVVTRQTATTATVKGIDKGAGTLSLMRPDGKTVEIKVPEPANLDKVKVGDELMITYTEADAISVERAG